MGESKNARHRHRTATAITATTTTTATATIHRQKERPLSLLVMQPRNKRRARVPDAYMAGISLPVLYGWLLGVQLENKKRSEPIINFTCMRNTSTFS